MRSTSLSSMAAVAAVSYIFLASPRRCCQSFSITDRHPAILSSRQIKISSQHHVLMVFRELVSDNEEDLRVNIASIEKKDGLDKFNKDDDRLCVIKVYAPWCKKCKSFGKHFRKLAIERGDAINSIGEVVRNGDIRFGEIEYSSNTKLVKELGINKFPTVIFYRNSEMIGEIVCKKDAIEKISAEIDNHLSVR